SGWELRFEIGEDVEVGHQGFAIVHVGRIFSGPEEALAGDAVETGEIDASAGEKIVIFRGEIVTDNGDNFRLREIAGGKGDVSARATQHSIYFSVRGFYPVICDRTYYDHGHSFDCNVCD